MPWGFSGMGDRVPNAPKGLGSVGRRLWRDVASVCEMRVDEEQTLGVACRMADDLARLEDALSTSEVWVKGSKGQEALNPLFAEVRQARLALARLLKDLGIAEVEDDSLEKSSLGRRLAGVRWHGSNERLWPREVA
jgi:hypothetical protein